MSTFGRTMIPKLPRRMVRRERLLGRLHGAIGNEVIVLEAPAGFGKTALLVQFVADLEYTPAWLTLDGTSGSPEVLAHQLGIALSGKTDLNPPATASKFSDLQGYVHAELAAALAASEQPLIIVIDNVHELADQREATHLLESLLDVLPDGNEVVLAGRGRPFLPSLNGRIATGEVALIESAELAFTLEEVRALGVDDFPGGAAELLRSTGGWPVGLMAALHGAPAVESGSAAAFEKYLETEVWAAVPEALRAPLRRFSLQPSITRSCVEMEFGGTAWRSLTSWLNSRDFLCEYLSPAEFRLNPLLRQFIANEFDEIDPEGYARAFQLVIDDLVCEGNIAEAVEFTRTGGSEQQLAALLERFSPDLIIQGALTLLLRAFECISEPTLRRRPLLRGMATRVTAHTGDPEEAVRRADRLLKSDGAPLEAAAHALLAKVRSLRLLGNVDEARATAEQLAALEKTLPGEPLRAEVLFNLAEFELSVTRDFLRAERLLRAVIEHCERNNFEPLGLLARSTLGQSLAMRGDAPAAVTVLTRAAQGWRSVGRSSNLGWVLNNLGMSHLQAGDFKSAASVLEEAVQEGLNCGNQRNVAYATASLGDAELALGRFEKARAHYEEAIRICATDALDESLAALSIAGLSAALLSGGDLQQADFFSRRALLVAVSSANSYEIATCKLQQAAVDFGAGNLVGSVAEASEAASRFAQMEVLPMLASAYYRVAMAQFKAGKRVEAEVALGQAAEALREPWMVGSLVPMVRENPMFAQWAATRKATGVALRDLLEHQTFETAAPRDTGADAAPVRFPPVSARSLGRLSVAVGGREVSDEDWASARAKEMFFLLLASREGIRKEEAVEQLYPDLPREKCNSAFHSNIYRVRRALYQKCVVKGNGGVYQLNPEGTFEWDVEQFEVAIEQARSAASGSRERAVALQEALEVYAGPFATAFQSEWAETIRARLEAEADESLATLAGYFAGREDFESAALCMERVLRANRFNEEAAFQLARYRTRAGQVVQALRFIDEYGDAYSSEFGEVLPERFLSLRAAIAAGVAV